MARDGSSTTWVMQGAVVVSILAHVSLIAAAGLRKERAPAEELAPPVDTWAGTTSAPIGGELHEVDVSGSETLGGSGEPPAPAPAPAAPSEPPAAAPNEPAEPPPPPKVDPPKPKVDPPKPNVAPPTPKSAPKTPKLAPGDDPPAPGDDPPAPEDDPPAPDVTPPVSDTTSPGSKKQTPPGPKTAPPGSKTASPSSGDKGPPGGSSPGGGGSFGAEGASSVRDLGRAFTRALPPACDADKTWATLPVGSGGSIEVAVVISEEGKITGVEPLAPNPPAYLLKAAKNTVVLLRGGTFALQGSSVTAGKQILRLSVELSDTTPPEDQSGAGAFGLASRWEGKRGVASFTQTSGRHVEIKVEFLRVELTRG